MYYVSVLRPVNNSANGDIMFRCIAKTFFVADNIRSTIESYNIVML